jgi:phage terminase large subunit-like protein
MGEICRPWIFDFVSALFGSYDVDTGKRHITEYLLSVAKKNAKSTLAAGIMLTALIRNWRKSAEFLILAPTLEIANNSFYPARDMVRQDEELSALLHVQEHHRTIHHRISGATLKVVAADNETVGGKKAGGVLVDELWLFGKKNDAENILREAMGGLASRPEGFAIYLTTQSDESPAGVFRSKLNYARAVRDGSIVDNRFLPVLYEFPPAMVKDGKVPPSNLWRVSNPNLGASVDHEFLEREYKKAQHAGIESLSGFYSKHLNIQIGNVLRADRWAGADFWAQQGRSTLTLKEILERSEVVEVGVDGGGLDDLLGLAVIGRDAETKQWLAWFHAWAHVSALEKRKSEAPRMLDLQKVGDMTIVERMGEDAEEVAETVNNIYKLETLDKIGVDPIGIGSILDAFIAKRIRQDIVVGISQGWKLGGAIKTAERKLAEGVLVHCAQPLMDWCVGNAKVEPRGNAILITKQASGTAKIDPLMAGFNAIQLMSFNPPSRRNRFQMFSLS